MCGIAGIVCKQGNAGQFIGAMTHALRHRGPDAQNTYNDLPSGIALGHTRLSIIDLSAAADQPFHSANGRFVVVFNGEIYNFRYLKKQLSQQHGVVFRTMSDTEVIAEGYTIWGTGIASRLEGMFAFAILDRKIGRILLFRDRVGKKPLFYFNSRTQFVFASEIKSILQHPEVRAQVRVRHRSLSTFLHLGYIPEPHTIYEQIHKFPAGHFAEVDLASDFVPTAYWNLEHHLTKDRISNVDEAKKQLQNLLTLSVEDRLVSDVPVGAFLSGGTDSSLVSAVASQLLSSRLKTFSVGFNDNKFDERKYAREVAKILNTDHEEFVLKERDAIDILHEYLRHFDEPFADTSAIPTMLVSKLARSKVKVALTGDGGDELFQGYGAYRWAARLNSPIVKAFRTPARWLLSSTGQSRALRVGHLLEDVSEENLRSHIFSQEQYFFSQKEIAALMLHSSPDSQDAFHKDSPTALRHLTAAERQALFDFEFYLKDDLLVKVDRASMYYGLECRSPLLDHRVIEFAFSLSSQMKVRDNVSKWILKELLKSYLPNELIYRKKWGFSVPMARWLKGELRYVIDDYLSNEQLEITGLFNVPYIQQLKRDFFAGRDYLYNRLWVVAVLQNWMKEHSLHVNA